MARQAGELTLGYSQYHRTADVPYPGVIEFSRPKPAKPPEPDRVLAVTFKSERLCIDCCFCRDGDQPTHPAELACINELVLVYPGSPYETCVDVRQDYPMADSCGPTGRWFIDAITGQWEPDV